MVIFLNMVNDLGKEARNGFTVSLLGDFIDFIVNQSVSPECRLEILKNVIILLESCGISLRQNLLSNDSFVKKLCCLFKSILEAGDYEYQVCGIEFLYRAIPKSQRAEIIGKAHQSSSVTELFLSIRESHFETDCRVVLNKLNTQNTSVSSRVFSFPAESVKIDGEKIYKPSDEDYDEFWIDFNMGSKRIGLFIEPNFPQSQAGEVTWETVSLWRNDVARCCCTNHGSFWKAVIELMPGALIYSSKDPDEQSHLFVILVSTDYPLQDALLKTFGESYINTNGQQKASSVPSPLSISFKNPQAAIRTSEDISKTNKSPKTSFYTLPPDVISTSFQQNRSNAKISVPMELMRTPASSIISSSSQVSLWNQTQDEVGKDSTEAKFSKSNPLPKNEFPEDSAYILEKDLGQVERLKRNKCSVSGPVVTRQNINANSTRNPNKISPCNKSSVKACGEIMNKYFRQVAVGNTKYSQKEQHKPASEDFANIELPNQSIGEEIADTQNSERLYPLVIKDEENRCPVRRSQRNIERGKMPLEEKKPREIRNESDEKKIDKNSKTKTKLNNKSSTNKFLNDANFSPNTDEKNAEIKSKLNVQDLKESKTPPPKSLRSSKKVKTPVVTIQASRTLDSESGGKSSKVKEDSTGISTLSPDSHAVRLGKVIHAKDMHVHNYEMVQEPTISSVYEERKREASQCNMRSQHYDKSPETIRAELLKRSLISPGCISEEDFKRPHIPFQREHSKKVNRKGKREKKDQSEKRASGLSAPIDDKLKKKHGLEVKAVSNEGNIQEKKAIREGSKREVMSQSCSEMQSDKYECANAMNTTRSPEEQRLGKDKEIKSSERNYVERKKQCVSDDHLDDNKKSKSTFQPSSKRINYSKLHFEEQAMYQSDILRDCSNDATQSHTKSGILIGHKDSLKSVDHPEQTTPITDGSKVYDNDEMLNACVSDENITLKSPKTKKKIGCFLKGAAGMKPHKSNHASRAPTKWNSCDDVSSSNSGFLYIETSHEPIDYCCDIIDETQCDKHTQQSLNVQNTAETPEEINSSAQIEPTQWSETNNLSKEHKLNKMNIGKKLPKNTGLEDNELNASGDCNLHNTEPQISSNMENSYVFNKCGFQKRAVNDAKVTDPGTIMRSTTQNSIDLNSAEPAKKRGDLGKEAESQNLFGTQSEKSQDKSKDNELTLPAGGCGDGLEISGSPEDGRPGRLVRQLRDRNKKISYKGWESFETGFDDEITPKNPISSTLSPTDDKRRSQRDERTMAIFGSMAPKKAPKENKRQRKTFWTSREIKTTVTTTSYSKMTDNSCSSDPYNFEADCATISTKAHPLLPFRSFTMKNSNSPSVEEQCVVDGRKACLKTNANHTKAQQEQYQGTTSNKMSLSQCKSHISKKSSSKKSKSSKDKGKKNACAEESVEFALFSSQRESTKKKCNTKKSMDFALFSSQKSQLEASKTGSGLVFPPLEDSIPCTPYDEIGSVASDDVLEMSLKKSALSECSWMKSQTPVAVQKKMRGKTYKKAKARHLEHQADLEGNKTDNEVDHGPLYQRLYYKQHQKRTPHQTRQRGKVLGRLEMEITPGRSPELSCLDKNFASSRKRNECAKDKVKQNVSSILTNSSKRSKGNSTKNLKRSLSFKSPSDHENPTSDELSDHKVCLAASTEIVESSSKKDVCLEVPTLSITVSDHSKTKKHLWENFSNSYPDCPWPMLTSKLDHQIQGVLDKVSDCLDPAKSHLEKTDTICSGPSSTRRPRQSFLKRKYAGQISSCSDHEDTSGSDCNQLENMPVPRKLFKVDSSPQSIKKLGYDTYRRPRTPKKKLFLALSYDHFSPQTPVRTSAQKKSYTNKPVLPIDVSHKKKKRKSQRKLELSPVLPRPNEDIESNAVKSVPSFDLISCYLSSPEKGREYPQPRSKLEKELCISPYMPLSVSIDASSAIGLSQLSSPELSNDINAQELESPPGPTVLLDTIKDDLMKPLTSQRSEGSSEDYCAQMIALPESSISEMDHGAVSHSSYASLRDFLTRKNMTKRPSLVNELDDATRQTVMCISSKWEDEQMKRVNAVKKFKNITENVLACMSQDIKETTECEKASVMLWEQQGQKLRKLKHAQEKELSKLKNAHDELKEQLQENQTNKIAHRDVRAVLKKDIESFKKKLEEKYNEHSLEAMKRCLQTSFFFS